jgi:hypothetical protein
MKESYSSKGERAQHISRVAVSATAAHTWKASRLALGLIVLTFVFIGRSNLVAQSDSATPMVAAGPYRISGIVVNSKSGAPLSRASVQIQDAKNVQSTRTVTASGDGHFEFRVAAGKFALQGAKHGFITSSYNAHEVFSSAVVTGAGLDTEHLVLRLPPVATLGGRILDEGGEPLRSAEVIVYREDRSSGISRIVPAETAVTDDQGAYEASPLAEGTYFVGVHSTPWYAVHPVTGRGGVVDRSLDVAYPITYYGDTTQSEEATPIPVRGGDHLQADVHLTPVPSAHLTFRADEEQGMSIRVLAPTFDGFEQIRSNGDLQMVSPGVYEMSGLAPGQYQVRMTDPSGQLKAPTEISISNGEELDSSSARSAGTVKIAVQMRDGSKLPENLQVALRSSNAAHRLAWEPVNQSGQVELTDVVPGRYDLLAGTLDRGYAVVRVSSSQGLSPGKTLEVPAGASLEISASIVGGMSNVEGLAKREGKASPGAMIVLVPEKPEGNDELFRRDQSDLDGTFTLPNVIPGNYTVIAIEDGWDLDWAKPAVLAPYLHKGQSVKVSDQTRGTIHLSTPVEVQKK